MGSFDANEYLQVANEISSGIRDEALWTEAFALENGDEVKTKAHYIRLRVEQLRSLVSDPLPQEQFSQESEISVEEGAPIPDRTLLKLALGNNSAYYIEEYKRMHARGNSKSWNWMAFLFNVSWALYRKLWLQGVVGLIVGSLISGVFHFIPAVEIVLLLVFGLVFGLRGNHWVVERASKLSKAEGDSGKDKQAIIQALVKKGGVSFTPLAIALGILATGLLAGQSLVSYYRYKETETADFVSGAPGQESKTADQASWMLLGEDTAGREFYYLLMPVERGSSLLVKPKVLISLAPASNGVLQGEGVVYRSALTTYEIDCEAKRIRLVETVFYSERMGGGNRLKTDMFPREWMPVVSGTLGGQMYPIVCAS